MKYLGLRGNLVTPIQTVLNLIMQLLLHMYGRVFLDNDVMTFLPHCVDVTKCLPERLP